MVNIGVIGCGYWGPNLIRNFSQIENCNVVYCCDLNEDRLSHIKKKYPSVKTTQDYNDILKDEDIDAVAIATSPSSHFKIAKDVLLGKKHVLIEKPITSNSNDAEELIKIAKNENRVLMVDHTFEYTPAVNKIKEIIKSGELGSILTIDMIRVNLGLFQKDINVIWDLAPHDVSIINYILECKPLSVRAIGESFIQKGIEDDVRLILKCPNKVLVNLHVSWLDPCKIRRITIVGNKKMLVYEDTEPIEKIKIHDKGVTIQKNDLPRGKYYDTFEEFQLVYRSGEVYSPKLDSVEPLNVMCRHFIDCIKNNKTPRSDGLIGLNVVKVIEAAQQSLKEKGREIGIE